VAGRVDEVQLVEMAVVRLVIETHGVGLDGDAPLALQVHRIQDLFHHFALRERPGNLQQAVRQGRLAVVDVRNDREIADEFAIHAMWGSSLPIIPHRRRPEGCMPARPALRILQAVT
jgi:hypothetical protein